MTNAVYEGKYEMDSLAAFLKLSRSYWRHSNNSAIFDGRWQRAVKKVISTIRVMQAGIEEYASNPPYKFQRESRLFSSGLEFFRLFILAADV